MEYNVCVLCCSLTRWHEVCHNAPYAIQEVLFAWEHGAITTEIVKVTHVLYHI